MLRRTGRDVILGAANFGVFPCSGRRSGSFGTCRRRRRQGAVCQCGVSWYRIQIG
jgi:hypothetical protein